MKFLRIGYSLTAFLLIVIVCINRWNNAHTYKTYEELRDNIVGVYINVHKISALPSYSVGLLKDKQLSFYQIPYTDHRVKTEIFIDVPPKESIWYHCNLTKQHSIGINTVVDGTCQIHLHSLADIHIHHK